MFHTCYGLIEEAKREKDKARHAYSHTIAAPNDLSAEDGANASGEDADAHAEQDDHSVANNPNAAGQLDATALQSTDASAKPSDRIVPNSPDTSGQLIPTSPHVMDEDAPTSSLSSSGSRPRTPTSGSGAASLPSRRNLGNAFNLANKSDSEYKPPETACSDNDEGGAVDGDANEGDADETESNHSVYHDDPNIVRPGEKPEDFVRLDSDDENDVNSVYDDDDDLGPTEPAVEDAGTAPDLHFQPSLLGAVGGVAEISRGNVSKNVLSDIKFNGWSEPSNVTPHPYMHELYEARPVDWIKRDYHIYNGASGPTPDALQAAETTCGSFFLFTPPSMWDDIAQQSKDYFEENLDARVVAQHAKQEARKLKRPTFQVQEPEQIKAALERLPAITSRELSIFIGLLIASTIAPKKEKFEHHWNTSDKGAIPRGYFNAFMKRDRFAHISPKLPFSSNAGPRASTDQAWKLRPVINALQRTFQAHYIPPPIMAFDEAMLPSRSTFNRMRVFMKDKPHKWGTKLFMLCSSQKAYCIRFEVYCGNSQMQDGSAPVDEKSDPAAVVRNLRQVFGPSGPSDFSLIVIDRFYTSVVLAIQLLTMKIYTIGTIMMNNQGLCEAILPAKLRNGRRASDKRSKNIERGTYFESLHVPVMKAIRWYDSQGVHILAAGGSGEQDRIVRRDPQTAKEAELMAPTVVKDYQTYMGGVDVHDQLRLQRYSLQMARRYKKYYRSLFLGLIDVAIINAFLLYNERRVVDGKPKASHVEFLKRLHLELIQLREEDWVQLLRKRGLQPTPTKRRQAAAGHIPLQTNEWRKGNSEATRKRCQRACKVCSVLKPPSTPRGGETTYYCGACKLKTASKYADASRVFLCNKIKHTSQGETITCFNICHDHWKNGTMIPNSHDGDRGPIRARKPRNSAGSAGGQAAEESDSGSDSSHPQQRKRRRRDEH